MLNNDFKELVAKYGRYKKQKKRTTNRRILFVALVAISAYILSTMNFQKSPSIKIEEKNTTIHNVDSNTTSIQSKKEENLSKITPTVIPTPKKHKPKVRKPKLQVTTRENSLEELLMHQSSSKSYSSTIALANFHYSNKEYEEAIKWAISASKKNQSNTRPWIIYAKSKKALGKREIAKKALQLFLKKRPNEEIQNLLNTL